MGAVHGHAVYPAIKYEVTFWVLTNQETFHRGSLLEGRLGILLHHKLVNIVDIPTYLKLPLGCPYVSPEIFTPRARIRTTNIAQLCLQSLFLQIGYGRGEFGVQIRGTAPKRESDHATDFSM